MTSNPNENASARLREQAATVRDDLRELGGVAREAAQEKLQEAGQITSDYVEGKKEQFHELEDELVAYVRAKPIQAVLMAAGIGALLGMYWRR